MNEAHTIILAAGQSSRMGYPKALLSYCGTTFVQHLVDLFQQFGPVVVVANADNRDAIRERLPDISVVVNPFPEQGLFSSVQLGLAAMPANASFYFLHPVDCPLVSEKVPAALLGEARANPAHTVFVPSHEDKPGHPVLVDPVIRTPLLTYPPEAVFSTVLDLFGVCRVPVADPSVLLNINNPADYDKLLGKTG